MNSFYNLIFIRKLIEPRKDFFVTFNYTNWFILSLNVHKLLGNYNFFQYKHVIRPEYNLLKEK